MVRTLMALATVAVSGCSTLGVGESTEFGCNKKQAGMGCASVEQVYKATNGGNYRQELATEKAGAARPTAPASVVPVAAPNWPTPVLEPAAVVRIWIAPWVDDRKALHWPSYVFAEVTPRKWSFGNMDFRSSHQLVPLQVDPRRPAEAESVSPPFPQPPVNPK